VLSHFENNLQEEDLSLSQVHNADGTGLLWKAVPENTQNQQKG
jgi:hypothetical protein